VLRGVSAALPAGEELLVAVRGEVEPAIELAGGGAAPPEAAAVARALLAPHGARVVEEAAPGRSWRLRIVLPRAPALPAAGSGAAFV
jgi:hypothetical protein